MPASTTHCERLKSPSYLNFALSILILLGILISYLPQHHRIISRRSSGGISPYFVLLGTTSGTCAFANILVLPSSRADIACCKEINGFECFAGLLGIAQVGVQWTCFTVILLLFLIFFPAPSPTAHKPSLPTYRTALIVAFLCTLHAIITFLLSLLFQTSFPTHLQSWANILGIQATILASIQFLPQLWTTWRLQAVGSLSIPTMCIQTPGSFVWAASLAARVGKEGWSTWGLYLVTGALQGGLLGMGVWFEFRNRRERRKVVDEGAQDGEDVEEVEGREDAESMVDERTGLIGNERCQ